MDITIPWILVTWNLVELMVGIFYKYNTVMGTYYVVTLSNITMKILISPDSSVLCIVIKVQMGRKTANNLGHLCLRVQT